MESEEIVKQTQQTGTPRGTGVYEPAADTGGGAAAQKTPASRWPLSGNLRNGTAAPSVPDAAYTGPYDQQLQDLYRSITERKPFEYAADDDAMYQQYKERYMQLGQQAMRDTLGQAADLTGGYGSSYAQAAGQQQYDQYMLGLNDKASELYAQAYQRYRDEGSDARQNYALLGDLADRDYGRWGDEYARRLNDYTLGLDEAAAMAQYGDFSGYAALYGPEAARTMLAGWAAQNPQLAYQQGAITPDQYQNLQQGLPMNEGLDAGGHRIGGTGAGLSPGGDPWDYGGSGWNGSGAASAAAPANPKEQIKLQSIAAGGTSGKHRR